MGRDWRLPRFANRLSSFKTASKSLLLHGGPIYYLLRRHHTLRNYIHQRCHITHKSPFRALFHPYLCSSTTSAAHTDHHQQREDSTQSQGKIGLAAYYTPSNNPVYGSVGWKFEQPSCAGRFWRSALSVPMGFVRSIRTFEALEPLIKNI